MDFSPEKLRQRFAELQKQFDKMNSKLQPLRDERDELVAKNSKEIDALGQKITKQQLELSPIAAEMAIVARALGGKTGE